MGNKQKHFVLPNMCRCWVSGWGKNDFNGVYQTIQKEVDVQVLSAVQCQQSLASTRLGPGYVFNSNSFMCAGGQPGKDACTVCITNTPTRKTKRIRLRNNFFTELSMHHHRETVAHRSYAHQTDASLLSACPHGALDVLNRIFQVYTSMYYRTCRSLKRWSQPPRD